MFSRFVTINLLLSILCSAAFAAETNFSSSLSDAATEGGHLHARDVSPNGTTFLWLLEDTYAGKTFFDSFKFFTGEDPTHGRVNYVNRSTAFDKNLTSFAQNDTKVIIKGDNTNWLEYGQYRDSVRVESLKVYNSGSLFVFDIDKAPWGCAVWPAWWTVGSNWPNNGEIDIIEGVHDNEHNQVAWHTADNCWFTPSDRYTGNFVHPENSTCYAYVNSNAGCAVSEWSRASYGPLFDAQGGGVFVMKWDEESISVWSFYRSAVPADLVAGNPSPSKWGKPSAELLPDRCPLDKYFRNHSIIINLTFCGDWAGNSYPPSCPGNCVERLRDPANFVNATWIINSLKVYNKQVLSGPLSNNSGAAVGLKKGWVFGLSVGSAFLGIVAALW